MNLREEILKEHSKKQTIRLAKWVGEDRRRFSELMDLFLHDGYRVVQRSAWIVRYVADAHPGWIKAWLKRMLEYCKKPVHDAVKRNIIRILTEMVKVFSMTVLANIAQYEPDLKQELKLLIEEQMESGTAGFKSRGRKILRQLEKPV